MYKRVEQIHRILKPTGSFYLHCDWHADAYLRVYVLDKIFGVKNFRNEIIWKYKTRVSSKKYWNRRHDNIFFYSKTDKYTFNWDKVTIPLSENTIKKYRLQDENGRYRLNGRGITGSPIRSAKDVDAKWEVSNPELVIRDYLRDGQAPEDLFELDIINQNSQERIGYPTQKPEALLERIIKASSNVGDVVLDCFMGGGTTIAVAQKLGRNWIGIDQSPSAFGVTRERIMSLSTQFFPIEFEAKTAKWDYDNLRKMDDFEFGTLVVKTLSGTLSKTKKGGDLGIDGIVNNWSVISVKRSDNVGRNVADNLRSAILRFRREKSVIKKTENLEFVLQHGQKVNLADYDGFIIAFSFGKGLKSELAQLEREEGFRILPLTVEDILPVARRPKVVLKVECEKLGQSGDYKFVATATTENERNIEFFAFKIWIKNKQNELELLNSDNFNKTGILEYELKKGEYKIVATATDEYGLTGEDEVEIVVR
jgi:DNA modification methylase